jgi:hypothetical protein
MKPENITEKARQTAGYQRAAARHQEANSPSSPSSPGETDKNPPFIFGDVRQGSKRSTERIHPVPDDSVLSRYIEAARDVSEAPDAWLVAPILALVGRLMTPNVKLSLGSLKPLTLFQFMAGPAGLRKSTSFAPAEALARELLDDDDQIAGVASDSALFAQFEQNPHRLQFEDEGNTMLASWANGSYGREAAARYLKLYDGARWTQSFKKDMTKDSPEASRTIENATLSFCVGSTIGTARMDGVSAQSGLRRRFGFYVASKSARLLEWPKHFNPDDHEDLIEAFAKIKTLAGIVGPESMTAPARDVWSRIQRENRKAAEGMGNTQSAETIAASLNESPARILKLAIIFQATRWAVGRASNPLAITGEMLEIAEAHQNACIEALDDLERLSVKAATSDHAETLLDLVRADFDRAEYVHGDAIVLSKSDITKRFANNPGRSGSFTTNTLYARVIPELIQRGDAKEVMKEGKLTYYAFRRE